MNIDAIIRESINSYPDNRGQNASARAAAGAAAGAARAPADAAPVDAAPPGGANSQAQGQAQAQGQSFGQDGIVLDGMLLAEMASNVATSGQSPLPHAPSDSMQRALDALQAYRMPVSADSVARLLAMATGEKMDIESAALLLTGGIEPADGDAELLFDILSGRFNVNNEIDALADLYAQFAGKAGMGAVNDLIAVKAAFAAIAKLWAAGGGADQAGIAPDNMQGAHTAPGDDAGVASGASVASGNASGNASGAADIVAAANANVAAGTGEAAESGVLNASGAADAAYEVNGPAVANATDAAAAGGKAANGGAPANAPDVPAQAPGASAEASGAVGKYTENAANAAGSAGASPGPAATATAAPAPTSTSASKSAPATAPTHAPDIANNETTDQSIRAAVYALLDRHMPSGKGTVEAANAPQAQSGGAPQTQAGRAAQGPGIIAPHFLAQTVRDLLRDGLGRAPEQIFSDPALAALHMKEQYGHMLIHLALLRAAMRQRPAQSPEKTAIIRQIGTIEDGLRLIDSLNNRHQYVQIPLAFAGQDANLELFVMKRGGGGKKINSEDATLFMSLDTVNLGRVEALIHLAKHNSVSLNLRAADERVLTLMRGKRPELHAALAEKSFKLARVTYSIIETRISAATAAARADGIFPKTQSIIDCRI